MITRLQCGLPSTIVTFQMPKAKGERIPRAKKTSDLVEDQKKKKKKSEAVDCTAHSPAHPLYHSSINSGLNQRISMELCLERRTFIVRGISQGNVKSSEKLFFNSLKENKKQHTFLSLKKSSNK